MVIQVGREHVFWQTGLKCSKVADSITQEVTREENLLKTDVVHEPLSLPEASLNICSVDCSSKEIGLSSAPSGQKIPLYTVCHSRSGDKGNDLNFSMIPHFPLDFERLKMIITPRWVKDVVSTLLNTSSFPASDAINKRDQWVNEHVKVEIYEVRGIHSLNVVVRNILDGGVNCSRRIDRHGKSISDLILSQQVVLPWFEWFKHHCSICILHFEIMFSYLHLILFFIFLDICHSTEYANKYFVLLQFQN